MDRAFAWHWHATVHATRFDHVDNFDDFDHFTHFTHTTMKLHADRMEGGNAISRHSTVGVIVSGVEYTHSVIVPWQGAITRWPPGDFAALTPQHFEMLAELGPELLIFGSGNRIRFAAPQLLRALMSRGIGFETMDTPAACRTYNVLRAEGRQVVAALLFEREAA